MGTWFKYNDIVNEGENFIIEINELIMINFKNLLTLNLCNLFLKISDELYKQYLAFSWLSNSKIKKKCFYVIIEIFNI